MFTHVSVFSFQCACGVRGDGGFLKNGLYKIGFVFSVVTSSVLTFELILLYNYDMMFVNIYFRKVFSVVVNVYDATLTR